MDFDHAVIAVRDLDQAIADYTGLGFTVTPGGEHAGGATHNALIAFADGSYLELIAFRPGAEVVEHPWWSFASTSEGLVDWAVRVDDVVSRAEGLRQDGLPLGASWDGGRTRPDGAQLQWKGTRPAPEHGLPFLIEDVTPRSLRVPSGEATTHANRTCGLEAIVVAVPNLEQGAQRYAKLLQVSPDPPAPDPLLATETVALPCGTARVILAAAPAGPIHERVERHGPGPYALILCSQGERDGWLDEQLAHGASIRLQPKSSTV